MYKTVVVGSDGSEFSLAALKESSCWIKRHGGKLILVHAVFFNEEEFGIASDQIDRRFELGKKICAESKEMLGREYGIEAESLVCQGEPHEVILGIAHEKKADLISLGTHGRKGIKRLIMGSVTWGVIAHAPCDVLVVKQPCAQCTGTYHNILVPIGISEQGRKALPHARLFTDAEGSEITALYVIPRYEEAVEFMMTKSIRESLYAEAERIIEGAKSLVPTNGVILKTMIEEGHVCEKIAETADRLKNDLIVLGGHVWEGVNKAIMGSTTEEVIMKVSCPILVIK